MQGAGIRVGTGAGFSDDRIDPAQALAERGELDYLVFECLAERTIARENLTRLGAPERGYTPYLAERFEAVLAPCLAQRVRIVSNMGAANPGGAARAIRELAQAHGLGDVPVAVVAGDDVAEQLRAWPQLPLLEDGAPLESLLPRMVSANAYLGADVVRDALSTGAPVVITGRVADPSLFLGCMLHGLDWQYDDYPRLAAGTLAGHLMECAAQLTGGCFADPGKKDVPGMATIGFPFAVVSEAAGGVDIVLGKLADSGGRLDVMTCTEQLLYEMHDPGAYITPDCVLDVSGVEFQAVARDRVRLLGARARPRTDSYKVVVGYDDGWLGEGEVGYAGPNALARARLAEQVVRERLAMRGFSYPELRVDYIGMSSLHGMGAGRPEPYEVRLRIAARSHDRKAAAAVGFEVRTLHVNGPAGGGGGSNNLRRVLAVKSVLLPRALVRPNITVEGGT